MHPLVKSLQLKIKDNFIETIAKPETAAMLVELAVNRATFSIDISETGNLHLFNDMLRHIQDHTLIKGSNGFKIHRSPAKSEDVISPGNGSYIFHVSNIPYLAFINEVAVASSNGFASSRSIRIRGLNTARNTLNKLIHVSYPEDIFLPYVFRDSDLIGLVETRYGHQRQFVNAALYDQMDNAFDRMVNHKEYYLDNDLPHKETALLYGPPGTGKSTIVRHFASKYGLNIYTATPRTVATNIAPLIGKPSIILLEDIDAFNELLQSEHQVKTDKEYDYSNFINFLDGVVPLKNVIVIMTTNFKEKLLESVIRTGRVDMKLHMKRFTINEVIGYTGWDSEDPRASYVMGLDPKIINVAVLKKLTLCNTLEECETVIKFLNEGDE